MSCTGIVETSEISGSSDGKLGWFKLGKVVVALDAGNRTSAQYAVMIDFVDASQGGDRKTSLELTPESAKKLANVVEATLSRGVKEGIIEEG